MLNGFGYAVDSLLVLTQSVVSTQAGYELSSTFEHGMVIALYFGMFIGALFWGLGADVVGRKFAFNASLLICSVFTIAAGASPNCVSLGVFIALMGFGAGGNLVLDTTVFLEYLPSNKQWVLTFMAMWWGVGQAVAGLIGYIFICEFKVPSCIARYSY